MAQLETAAGDANDPVDAAGPLTEDEAAAAFGDLPELADEPLDPNNPEAGDDEPGADDDAPNSDDDDADEPESPAIDPPVSWNAEAKEAFKALPPELQQVIATRETERDRFVQSKGQEAANTRAAVENEARSVIAQLSQQTADELHQYAALIQPLRPSPDQFADWHSYAQANAQYENALAQRHSAQQQAEQYREHAQQQQEAIAAAEMQRDAATLRTSFPEWFDPATSTNRQQELTAIARDLGYSEEHVGAARAVDILAMRKAAEWKVKADQLDKLNKARMQTVREAKTLPKVSRPGVAQPAGSGRQRDYQGAVTRLRETGSIHDAAAALARL